MSWNSFISYLIFLISYFIFTILDVYKILGYALVPPAPKSLKNRFFVFLSGMERKNWPEISLRAVF